MEIVFILTIISSLVTNAYLIKKQSDKPTVVEVHVPHIQPVEVEPLEAVIESNPVTLEIDYEKLAEALSNLPKPVVIVETPQVPVVYPTVVPQPTYPTPYPNYPYIVSNSESVDAGSASNDFEINGIPVKRYPSR